MQRRFEDEFQGRFIRRWRFGLLRLKRWVLFWRDDTALDQVLAQYGPDRLYRVLGEDRARAPAFQKCIACSLCTFSCRAVREGMAPPSFEPKQLAIGFGRGAIANPQLPAAWAPCASCDHCTVECPNDVPVHAIAESLIGMRKTLTSSEPRP